jgi:hypothetical protein
MSKTALKALMSKELSMKHNPHCMNPAHMGILSVDGQLVQNPAHKGILSVGGKIIQNPLHGLEDSLKKAADYSLFGVASVGSVLALYGAYCAYQNHVAPMLGMKKNPRRRKNALGMKKNSAKQKRAQSRAKKAMALYHSGKARSLKAAWKMV